MLYYVVSALEPIVQTLKVSRLFDPEYFSFLVISLKINDLARKIF